MQTREALQAILKDLHEEDHFALVVFDTKVLAWQNSLTKATKKNILQATNYVKKIKDQGCTWKIMLLSNEKLFFIPPLNTLQHKNTHVCSFLSATALNAALLRAVNMLKKDRKAGNLPQRSADMIITLTDGMPNHGEPPQSGRLGRIKCCVRFYGAPVPAVFMT